MGQGGGLLVPRGLGSKNFVIIIVPFLLSFFVII